VTPTLKRGYHVRGTVTITLAGSTSCSNVTIGSAIKNAFIASVASTLSIDLRYVEVEVSCSEAKSRFTKAGAHLNFAYSVYTLFSTDAQSFSDTLTSSAGATSLQTNLQTNLPAEVLAQVDLTTLDASANVAVVESPTSAAPVMTVSVALTVVLAAVISMLW